MFPSLLYSGGRARRALILSLIVLVAGGIYVFLELGQFMTREDPLAKADAIFVLAGTRVDRPMEAADLFLAGYAPHILVTRAVAEQGAMDIAQRRGVRIPTDFDLSKDVLLALGVPQNALVAPDRIHDNTGEEAQTLREMALQHRWKRVIVVSSKYHLRRVALACRRALNGTGVEIVMRGSRYDPATPERWWRRRYDLRWVASEVPKLVAYYMGASS